MLKMKKDKKAAKGNSSQTGLSTKLRSIGGKHIGTKLNIIFSASLIFTIAVVVCFVSVYNMNILEKDFQDSCSYNMNAIAAMKDNAKDEVTAIADKISSNASIIDAVQSENEYYVREGVKSYVNDGVTEVMVLSGNGSKIYSFGENADAVMSKGYMSSAKNSKAESFVDVIGQSIYAVVITPIGNATGSMAVMRKINDEKSLDALKNTSGADYTIFLGNTRVATTVTKDGARQVGTTMSAAVENTVIKNKQNYTGQAQVIGQDYIVNYMPLFDRDNNVVGALFTGKSLLGVRAQNRSTTVAASLIGVLLFAVMDIVLLRFIKKKIVNPLKRIVRFSGDVAGGNLGIAQTLDDAWWHDSENEIGIVFNAQKGTVNAIRDYIGEIDKVLNDLSNGKLTTPIVQDYKGDFVSIRNALTQVQTKLIKNMTEINQAANILSSSANEISAASQALAQGATEQAGSVEELNATIDDVYRNVKTTAENAQNASAKTEKVGKEVNEGDEKVHEMITAMDQINDASSKIEKIIKTIEDIAFQTNILALNAAVEAARAGVAGKGFAVVADEVRNLAGKSAAAAKDTTALIQNSLRVVKEGSEKAGETADVMKRVVTAVSDVVSTIGQISTANEEQAVALGQIQSGMAQIAQVVHTTSASAEESAATAEELEAQAKLLEELVSTFQLN